MDLKNKKILIIIGGGISAYKSLDFIRLLRKNGSKVKTILTKSGKQFVTPLSITSLLITNLTKIFLMLTTNLKWIIFLYLDGQI